MIVRGAALACLLLAGACTPSQQKSARDVASAAPQSAQDAVLAAGVKAKLATIDVDSAMAVRVDVAGGNVTLVGEVRDRRERDLFESAARSVSGVKSLSDKTRVNSRMRGARESLGDAALVAKVMGAIGAQAGINAFTLHAAAKDGNVTLTGTAPTQAVKQTVLETARKVGGVRSVTDRITVKS